MCVCAYTFHIRYYRPCRDCSLRIRHTLDFQWRAQERLVYAPFEEDRENVHIAIAALLALCKTAATSCAYLALAYIHTHISLYCAALAIIYTCIHTHACITACCIITYMAFMCVSCVCMYACKITWACFQIHKCSHYMCSWLATAHTGVGAKLGPPCWCGIAHVCIVCISIHFRVWTSLSRRWGGGGKQVSITGATIRVWMQFAS